MNRMVHGVGKTVVFLWRRFVEPWVPQERERREIPCLSAVKKGMRSLCLDR